MNLHLEIKEKEANSLKLLEAADNKTSLDSDKKLLDASEQEAIKEVIKNEIVNPDNLSLTQKKNLIADKINDNLTNNSAFVIDNTKSELNSDLKTEQNEPLEKENNQSISIDEPVQAAPQSITEYY